MINFRQVEKETLMIKLIASDLDGTILKNGAQELPAGFCDIVKRLKEK